MRLWAVLWVMSVGCAASKADRAEDSGASEPLAAGNMDDEDETNFSDEQPAAWELSGDIVLDLGVIVEAESLLQVRLLTAERVVLCETSTQVELAVLQEEYPETGLVGWWRLYVEGPQPNGCFGEDYDFPVPASMLLGIGPMHPEIIAAVGADGSLESVDSLNGAYASLGDDAPVWVFGVIGTEAAYVGLSGPEESAPLSDGTWRIEPVYSFPL